LKGTQEVEFAPDRRAAAEMALIRLCYAADLPPPGDVVKRLMSGGGLPQAPSAPGGSGPGGAGFRAAAGGGASVAIAATAPAAAARRASVAEHPFVRAILEAFPGARIDSVHDSETDEYGLPRPENAGFAEPSPERLDYAMENDE